MKKNGMKNLLFGGIFIATFVLWTVLIQMVDVQPHGQNGTNIGFATLNCWFHRFTGVHMMIYSITDWMGLVPVVVCLIFAGVGLVQLIKKRSLFKVDPDIIILGIYYIVVILAYIFFEMIPINYRPILINGVMEASYPSSTTLLVLCVMPTLIEQTQRRLSIRTSAFFPSYPSFSPRSRCVKPLKVRIRFIFSPNVIKYRSPFRIIKISEISIS